MNTNEIRNEMKIYELSNKVLHLLSLHNPLRIKWRPTVKNVTPKILIKFDLFYLNFKPGGGSQQHQRQPGASESVRFADADGEEKPSHFIRTNTPHPKELMKKKEMLKQRNAHSTSASTNNPSIVSNIQQAESEPRSNSISSAQQNVNHLPTLPDVGSHFGESQAIAVPVLDAPPAQAQPVGKSVFNASEKVIQQLKKVDTLVY